MRTVIGAWRSCSSARFAFLTVYVLLTERAGRAHRCRLLVLAVLSLRDLRRAHGAA